ncbi:MAG: beta-lactamase family protein [Chloroflexota bacterium]|nr:beta-lactamase family protein [Chloroflexota bacterium]
MMQGDIARALDRHAARLLRRHVLTGAMFGVVHDQQLAWSRGLGSPDRDRPLDAHTLSRVASITKTFTATAVVQLRDVGKLRLDDPLVLHLPEFGAVRNPFGPIEDVTLRKLLCHHAGIVGEPPTGHWQSLHFPTREEVLAALPRVEVVIPPGSAFKYSNLGYTLLGEVVERASGRPVLDYLRSELLEPLGMADATFAPSAADRPRNASGHLAHAFEDWAAPAPPSRTHGMAAAAELYASVHDLGHWLSLQFRTDASERSGAQVLRGPSLAEMHRPQYVEPDWSLGYCLGWRANRRGDRIWHGHGGGLPGFRSQILFNVPERVGVVVLIDGMGPADQIALDLAEAAAGLLAEAAPAPAPPAPVPTPDHVCRFLGLYRWVHFGELARVEYRGGRLVLVGGSANPAPGSPPCPLEPTDVPNTFLVHGGRYAGERLTFGQADDGRVTGFSAAGFAYTRLADPAGEP